MLRNSTHLFALILSLYSILIFPQEYPTGLLLDDHLYQNSSRSPILVSSDLSRLPSKVSLEMFTPPSADQQGLSTCAGWAVSYYARSILEALKYDYSGRYVELNTFSPSFVYNKIRPDTGCSWGVSLTDALDVLKIDGSLKLSNFEYDCTRTVGDKELWDAKKYKIKDYREIFSRNDKNKTLKVKKSLSEKKPVVIAIDCPPTFNKAGEFWTPDPADYKSYSKGHALTVIAYDDELNGGSFKVINSWGNNWGKNGTTWIKYNDFDFFTYFAFELIDFPRDDLYSLSGDLKFILENEKVMKTFFNGKYFEMEKPYLSGTKFQVLLKNMNPAYVYVFSTDLRNNVYMIFPPDRRTSAFLPYRESTVALPDEFHYNILDETKGKSYYIFLYSKNEININQIVSESSKGNFFNLLSEYFGHIEEDIILSEGESITFKSNNSDSLVYLVIEFKHK